MRMLFKVLATSAAVFIAAQILPGVAIRDFTTAVIVAVVLGVANAVVRPILIFLTLPATILTLGLFLFVINSVIVLTVDALVPGFGVSGFWWAMLFSVTVSLINCFLNSLGED
jgi:putative membrane protein